MIENKLEDERLIALNHVAEAGLGSTATASGDATVAVASGILQRAAAAYCELPPAVANIPLGQAAFEQILGGRVPIVDLHPEDDAAFLKRHRFSVQTALKLASQRAIVPNVYITDAQLWKKSASPAVAELANHRCTIASAERTKVLLGGDFKIARDELIVAYEGATHGFDDADWMKLSKEVLRRPETDAKGIVGALASRAARVKVAAPTSVWTGAIGALPSGGDKVERLGLTIQHGRRIRSANHVFTGFVTASAGKSYVPGSVELELAREVGFLNSDEEMQLDKAATSTDAPWSAGANFLALVLRLPVPTGSGEDAVLLDLWTSDDVAEARRAVADAIVKFGEACFRGDLDETRTGEVATALQKYEERVQKFGTLTVKDAVGLLVGVVKVAVAKSLMDVAVALLPALVSPVMIGFRFLYRPHMRRLASSVGDLKKLGMGRSPEAETPKKN